MPSPPRSSSDGSSDAESPQLARGWRAVDKSEDATADVVPEAEAADENAEEHAFADEEVEADKAAPLPATDEHAEPMGNAALLGIGIFAGVYLLFTFGWFIAASRVESAYTTQLTDVMFQGAKWGAIAAPALFFVTVLALTAHRRPWIRFVWFAVGALLLIPWPFIMVGAVG